MPNTGGHRPAASAGGKLLESTENNIRLFARGGIFAMIE